jgi:predicted acetyltransferase
MFGQNQAMEMKVYSKLPSDLARRVKQFVLENFYREEERTPEHLVEEEDKFFSQPKAWLLVFENNELTGRLLLHKRKIAFANKEVVLGGIGGVCTRRDRRRQGLAMMMLKKAVEILKNWGCDIAYLCANIEKSGSLYSRTGFVPLNRPYTYYGRSGKLYEENNGMIASLNSPSLFEEVLNSKQKLHLGNGNW